MANPKSVSQRAFVVEPYDSLPALINSKSVTNKLVGQRLFTKDGYCVDVVGSTDPNFHYVSTAGARLKRISVPADPEVINDIVDEKLEEYRQGALMQQFIVQVPEGTTLLDVDVMGRPVRATSGYAAVFMHGMSAPLAHLYDYNIEEDGKIRLTRSTDQFTHFVIETRERIADESAVQVVLDNYRNAVATTLQDAVDMAEGAADRAEDAAELLANAVTEDQLLLTVVDGQTVYTEDDEGAELSLASKATIVSILGGPILRMGVDVRVTSAGALELLQSFAPGSKLLIQRRMIKPTSDAEVILSVFEDRVRDEADRAEAAAADAVNNAPWSVKDTSTFLALTTAVVGARYHAPGMAWDVVARGTVGSIDHPTANVGYFVVNVVGSDLHAWAQPSSPNFGAEFQRAIENSASGELYLPGGEYTATALHLNRSITIRGTNRKRTKLVLTGGIVHEGQKASIVASGADSEGLSSQMSMSDMEIQVTAPDTNGILIMRKMNMSDVHVRGAANNGILFFSGNPNTKAPYFCQFDRVWSKQNGKSGLRISENCNANMFNLCQFDSNGEHGVRLERFGTPSVNQVLYNTIFMGGQASYNQMDGYSLLHSVNTQIIGSYAEYNSQIDGGNPKSGAFKNMQLGSTAARNLIHMGEVGTDVDPDQTLSLNTVLSNTVTIGGRLYSPDIDLVLGYQNVGTGRKIAFNGAGSCAHSIEFKESSSVQARLLYDGSPATPNNVFAMQTTNDNGASWNTLISGLNNGRMGFYGATPVVRQTVAPAATDAASAITLANSIRTALINLGLAQ
jgi:hypothetical protein